MSRLFFAVLFVAACGGGDSGSEPVAISLANLEGYWVVASPESGGPRPGLLHFGLDPYPGEAPEGATHVGESDGQVVTYALVGQSLQLEGRDGSRVYEIESLTRDTMVARYGLSTLTLTRQSDCAGPGFWMDSRSRIVDAAWDRFGGLHVISGTGERTSYGWVAPGRCAITLPETTLIGATIDIADNGDIRLLQFARSGALPGEITVTTVPAKPWARDTLDSTRKIYPAPSTPANDPPPLRSIEIDGQLVVFYAYGSKVFVVSDAGETELTLSNASTFTPGLLTITHLPDGSWILREGNGRQGLRYVDGRYEPWSAERVDASSASPFASIFAYDGDTLYAAWSVSVAGSFPALVVGKKVGDTWQHVSAGAGFPMALRVSDGVIDVIGSLDDRQLGPMVWTRLPSFAENVWRQEYQLGFDATINAVVPRSKAAGGLFGPGGEIFMAVEGAVWRRPNAERAGESYHWGTVSVTFEAETDAAVVFPTLGVRCTEDCTFAAPSSAIFPAEVEVPGEAAASRLVGARIMPNRDSYGVQVNPEVRFDAGPTTLRLESTLRRMDPVALGPDEVQSSAGVAVAYPGGFAVTRNFGGVVLSKIEGGAVVDEVELSGVEPGRLRVREGGGFALPLMAPTLTKAGVGLLAADLTLEAEVPFPEDLYKYVVTDDGFIGFRYDGATLVFAVHTTAGATPAVASPVADTTELVALGDGFVAFDRQDKGTAPTFVGDPSRCAWRKVGGDGVIDWTLSASRSAQLVWSLVDGDLFVATGIGATFEIGGETYGGGGANDPSQYFVGRFDGATGALKTQRVVSVPGLNGIAQPTSITGDAGGVLLSESFAANLRVVYVPLTSTDAPTRVDYEAQVIGGYCLQPGVQCSANPASFAALGGGRFGGVWTQLLTTNYDGELVESVSKKATAGVFTPAP